MNSAKIINKIYEFGAVWGINKPKECDYLLDVFTHKSYINNKSNSFERLEFLGDSILGAIVTKELNNKMPSIFSEGDLSRARTNLVNKTTLSEVAKKLNMPDLILMGKSELNYGYNFHDKILSDTYEAFIGALFINNNDSFESCDAFIRKTLYDNFQDLILNCKQSNVLKDFKSQLQEFTQIKLNCLPEYKMINHKFENNKHSFMVEVQINKVKYGLGLASDRRSAEQIAAHETLNMLKDKDCDFKKSIL